MSNLMSADDIFRELSSEYMYERYCKRLEFKNRAFKAKTKLELLPIGREYYQWAYNDIMDERSRGHSYYPYVLPFADFFSPIEFDVWCWIRYACVPLLPEFPADKYYIDFADPYTMVGIECDGKQWHNAEKDKKRDAILRKLGWTIYRLTGTQITRSISKELELEVEEKWNECDEYENRNIYYSDFRREYLDQKIGYGQKYASAILSEIFHRHFNKKCVLYG